MKILIDTNILINLEDNRIINEDFSQFYRLAISNNCKVLYHPKAITCDLSRDKDKERKEITISKLKKYEPLLNYSIPQEDFYSILKNRNINDEIDNIQLFQLYKRYVDYFVTEDNGIHLNAKTLKIEDRVLNIKESKNLLLDLFTIIIPNHPILREQSIRNIENKFNTSFFDSLREDYGGKEFDNWLYKCAKQDRKCYSLVIDDNIKALLIYNIEDVKDHKLNNIYEKALKICTFKVSQSAFGIKLGELFLQKMFEYCIEQKINFLYLTVYEKQNHLIELLQSLGFNKNHFINKQGIPEIQMVKCLDKSKVISESSENIREIHPYYYDNNKIGKYVIPIRPEYYSTLFKDGKLREPSLFDATEESINEIHGNTIVKAYISNSPRTNLKVGDLLFFYASVTSKMIEPVGILESIQIINNFEDLMKIVSGKTVFSQDKLKNMLDEKGSLNVIIFRLITYLKEKINLKKIQSLQSFKNKIPTITTISESDYLHLKEEGYFDGRYIIN